MGESERPPMPIPRSASLGIVEAHNAVASVVAMYTAAMQDQQMHRKILESQIAQLQGDNARLRDEIARLRVGPSDG